MALLLLVSFFVVFCQSAVPPRWGKYGPYSCVNKSVEVGGYVSHGSQNAILLYPSAAFADKTTLPFVAFAHGMTAGGNLLLPEYQNVLQEVCSYGYIIAAPQSCSKVYCETFYEDVISTITTLSAKRGAIDPALEYADFSKIGVYGHSMGGAATVHVSDYSNLNISCAVAMHPALAQENNQSTSADATVPMLWIAGAQDTTVTDSIVYNGFKQDTVLPKVYVDLADATHINMIDDEAPYIAQYFDCYIRGIADSCGYFLDINGANNLCTGGLKTTNCYVCNDTSTDGCFN